MAAIKMTRESMLFILNDNGIEPKCLDNICVPKMIEMDTFTKQKKWV